MQPASAVHDLVVLIDSNLTMRVQVGQLVARCYNSLRKLRLAHPKVSAPVMHAMVTLLVLTHLDYCNSTLKTSPAVHLRRLQSVQNAAARLVFNLRRSDDVNVTDALMCMPCIVACTRADCVQDDGARLSRSPWNGAVVLSGPSSGVQRSTGLRSSGTTAVAAAANKLVIPSTRCVTIGPRAFPVSGSAVWNGLPTDVTSAPSLFVFRRRLKNYLFISSYSGAVV